MKKVRLAPSILSADLARLGQAVGDAEAAGADLIHVDVMDGHFVPNLTFGPAIVAAIRPLTRLPIDVHLMIEQPERFLEAFARAGADGLTVHPEATPHLHRALQQIRSLGLRAGVALNPATPESALTYVLPLVDLVLVMTVNPGFGGQSFLPENLPKITTVRRMLDDTDNPAWLEVDGGIAPDTAPAVIAAGADTLVAGSAIFSTAQGIAPALAALRAATL